MVIQHNLGAQNASRQYGMVKLDNDKSVEKLSSGYRINRAGDDAAGLTISESMRYMIRGLNMASRNAQDGVSFIQVADG
ncbi:MAG: flagellin, partial [Lachnospiraceae bacterium]